MAVHSFRVSLTHRYPQSIPSWFSNNRPPLYAIAMNVRGSSTLELVFGALYDKANLPNGIDHGLRNLVLFSILLPGYPLAMIPVVTWQVLFV